MYTCNWCSSAYVWPDSLKRHVKYKHGEEECRGQRRQQEQQQQGQQQQQEQQQQGQQQQPSMSPQHQEFVFPHPFTANVSGPTCSSKTYFVKTLLQHCMTKVSLPPQRILWLYKRWQTLYDIIKATVCPPVGFIRSIPLDLEQDSFVHPGTRNLVILDDLMSTAAKDSRINELFTEGSHHRNMSVMAINQNLYYNKDPTREEIATTWSCLITLWIDSKS